MHVLLANDDGIGSVGIMALMDAALARGHKVSMCAPSGQQSAASSRITLNDPLYVKNYPLKDPAARGVAITGTPVDCVRLALRGGLLEQPADLLISGINNGYNAGTATHYSGTVGAALEGAVNGIPSIAASIDYDADPAHVRQLADYVLELGERFVQQKAPSGTLLNINAPDLPRERWAGVTYAPLSRAVYLDGYERREAARVGTYFWLEAGSHTQEVEEGCDIWYVKQGYVTLTLVGGPQGEPEEAFASMGLVR